MEGVSNGTSSCMMSFGENTSNGEVCPMMMMMPLMPPSHHDHHQHHPINPNTNCPYLPIATTTSINNINQDQNNNRNTSSSSSFVLDHNNSSSSNPAAGCYFMENNNDCSNSSVKAKIMAHPHYQRLLAAYVNCQKVISKINKQIKQNKER